MEQPINIPQEVRKPCPQFPHFGAHYPDACCIDGFLWDLDSCDDEGMLCSGGDDPCPFCNTEASIEQYVDEEGGRTKELMLDLIQKLREKYG